MSVQSFNSINSCNFVFLRDLIIISSLVKTYIFHIYWNHVFEIVLSDGNSCSLWHRRNKHTFLCLFEDFIGMWNRSLCRIMSWYTNCQYDNQMTYNLLITLVTKGKGWLDYNKVRWRRHHHCWGLFPGNLSDLIEAVLKIGSSWTTDNGLVVNTAQKEAAQNQAARARLHSYPT